MLRPALSTDRDAVYEIYMDPHVIPFLGFDPMSAEDFHAVFHELLESRSFYVFERGGSVLAFCRCTRQAGRGSHVARLSTLAVAPHSHGAGVAREMLEQITSSLSAQGVLRLELTLEADNPRALAFYLKLGFEREGRMRAAYKRATDLHYTDEIFMAKLLAELPVA